MNTGTVLSYKLFLDDERFPITNDWVIARTSDEAIALILMHGMPHEISFDHDLGGDDTSRVFINFLMNELSMDAIVLPLGFKFSVHSQNSVGAKWITGTMNNLIKHFPPHD